MLTLCEFPNPFPVVSPISHRLHLRKMVLGICVIWQLLHPHPCFIQRFQTFPPTALPFSFHDNWQPQLCCGVRSKLDFIRNESQNMLKILNVIKKDVEIILRYEVLQNWSKIIQHLTFLWFAGKYQIYQNSGQGPDISRRKWGFVDV